MSGLPSSENGSMYLCVYVVFEGENVYQTIEIMKVRLDYITAAFSSLVYVPPLEETAVGSGQVRRLLYVLCLRNRDILILSCPGCRIMRLSFLILLCD